MTVSDIYSQLVAVFVEWQGFLKDPQYVRCNNEITWSGARAAFLPALVTKEDTASISREGQYTFRIAEDNSILQMSYKFLQLVGLESARLAYYEVGTAIEEEDIVISPLSDDEDSTTPARWVRFDYCHTGRGRILHMDSHLHISGLPGTRFAVTGIPTPKQFVEFVVSHFYPNIYEQYRLSIDQQFRDFTTIDKINSSYIHPTQELAEVYSRISHFRIPGF